ncbi:cation:proton antiporter [Gilvimarinus algae]|uniref:Monovalent cation/H(+) antiporter subunit G n=1 Tax=Gilvimarinus algae TaxID=3058037 RepID=A0ABT8TJR9_9GAMM|nr:monovalent cation/H(+) antiporter subunit G [Gilvimarinus sp. SDUM040014]MDO3383739.1 monovalent cation/H(+) antiporter subunit G [Gilvimarinus sp. SDUM040014]
MAEWLWWLSWPFLVGGVFFFIAGSIGILRFDDAYSRLHALTKADTLGLGLVVLGLGLQRGDVRQFGVMLLIWLLVIASGATACQLLARYEREQEDARTSADD